MEHEQVDLLHLEAGLREHLRQRQRRDPDREVEDLGAVHEEVEAALFEAAILRSRPRGELAPGAQSAARDDEVLRPRAIRSVGEPGHRRLVAIVRHHGRRRPVTEDRPH